jgi:hypothetical protein
MWNVLLVLFFLFPKNTLVNKNLHILHRVQIAWFCYCMDHRTLWHRGDFRNEPNFQSMTCDFRLQLANVRLQLAEVRCACRTLFGSNLQYWWVQCIFRVAKCDRNIALFLLLFGVSYNFVAQKWRIFAIFYKKKSTSGKLLWKYWNLKQCFKGKIFN